MRALTVEQTIWIAAPRERIWQAITQTDQIMQWWGGDHWAISALEIGAQIEFGDPDDPMIARVAIVDPPREFAIEWPPQAQYHAIAMVTRYVLKQEAGGTRVTVTETGFEALPEEIRQQRFDRTAAGYATVLQGLKTYIEQEQL